MTAPVATSAAASLIASTFSSARRARVERDHRGEPGLERHRRDDRTGFEAASAACSAVRQTFAVVRQDDHLARAGRPRPRRAARRSTGSSSGRRRRRARRGSRTAAGCPAPPATATSAHGASAAVGHGVEQPLLALERLRVHVRDLDARDRPARDAERERAAGVVGVDVHLERASGRRRRAASRRAARARASSASASRRVALDDEDGAVAEARELLVDRRRRRAPRRLGAAAPAAARPRAPPRSRARSRRARPRRRRRRPPR